MLRTITVYFVLFCLSFQALSAAPQNEEKQLSFRVKYVAADAIYLDSGLEAGLKEGMD